VRKATIDRMHDLAATELAALVRERKLAAQQVMRHFLDRTQSLEPALNTYATLDAEGAMAAAHAVDARIAAGEDAGPLAGLPVSVKDLIAAQGLPLTFGSRLFAGNVAPQDAPSVQRVRQAGGCIVGKTTTSELGSKAVGDSPLTGVTVNPWRAGHTPGGSSAGAAAGVAARLVPLALGTDGGGSIRIPSSFCGLVGIKGSFGRVPVWPPSATPGLAHVGPLARSVDDAILLFTAIAGPHEGDPASGLLQPARCQDAAQARDGLRIGLCEDFHYGWAVPEARSLAHEAARAIGAAFRAQPQRWDGLREDPATAWSTEFYSAIARRLDLAGGPKTEVESQLDPALALEIASMRDAGEGVLQRARDLKVRCVQDIAQAFERFDLLVMPTMPVSALPVGRNAPAGHEGAGAVAWSYFTYPFNLAGNPAASYPAGLDASGMPLGVQLVAPLGGEALLFDALRALERALPAPPLPAMA
jgi:aspartyl-tRNA(Asn)/glutamyl-tRNA(Gln) amidotransferase subunit A